MTDIGVQSWVYRKFDPEEIVDELADLPVTAIEPCRRHIAPGAGEEEVAAFRDTFESAGIDICGWGVYNYEGVEDVEASLDLAAGLGAEYVSVDFEPDDEAVINALVEGAAERDLLVAIHNHGPDATYSTVEEVLAVVEDRDPLLGACVDTGHYFRSGQSPGDVVPALGERVHAVHFKDFADPDTEVIPGEGQLDIDEFLALLDEHTTFDQPLVIEYEEDFEDPTPHVAEICDRLTERL
jgi:inosose dehydratase